MLVFGKEDVHKSGQIINNVVRLYSVMRLVHLSPEIGEKLFLVQKKMLSCACISQF